MADQRIITEAETMTGLGSIAGSLAYLNQQAWWRAFRETRPSRPVIDDALWIGHLCRWLQQRQVAIDRCTKTELGEYLATIESFRAGPRLACEGTVTALVDFLGARATSSAFSAIEAR